MKEEKKEGLFGEFTEVTYGPVCICGHSESYHNKRGCMAT